MGYPDQAVVLLNVDAEIARNDLLPFLPTNPGERKFYSLSDFDPPPVGRSRFEDALLDWLALAAALQRLLEALPRTEPGRSVEYHIAARAPLSLVVMLGMGLSPWEGAQFIYNQDRTGAWHRIALGVPHLATEETCTSQPFFDIQRPLFQVYEARGWVALCVSLRGGAVDRTPVRAALGPELGGIEELAVAVHKPLTAQNAQACGAELRRALSGLKTAYPNASGLALFIDGPIQLAYMLGREINPKVFSAVRVYHYRADRYELSLEFPWRVAKGPLVEHGAADILRRHETLVHILCGLEELQQQLLLSDLPENYPGREDYVARLRRLRISGQLQQRDFDLRLLRDEGQLGEGLVDVLSRMPPEMQQRIGRLLLLHELLHFDQGLYHSNFTDIGRAGIALEEVDYQADAFSIEVAVRWTLRQLGDGTASSVAACTEDYVRAALLGMQAFDEMEQGPRLWRLPDRRMRRYLAWHFQLQRAGTLRSLNDLAQFCRQRVVVDLAPLQGYLDRRYDKFVRSVQKGETQLIVVASGRLRRLAENPSLNLSALLEAVCSFAHQDIQKAMRHVVEEHRQAFVPWRNQAASDLAEVR